jgi:hypothetical protein
MVIKSRFRKEIMLFLILFISLFLVSSCEVPPGVQLSGDCGQCTPWEDGTCGAGECEGWEMKQGRQCTGDIFSDEMPARAGEEIPLSPPKGVQFSMGDVPISCLKRCVQSEECTSIHDRTTLCEEYFFGECGQPYQEDEFEVYCSVEEYEFLQCASGPCFVELGNEVCGYSDGTLGSCFCKGDGICHVLYGENDQNSIDCEECTPGEPPIDCNLPDIPGSAGVCNEGLKTCQEDFSWGPCEQITFPVDEICGNGLDDDCDKNPDHVDDDCYFMTCVTEELCEEQYCDLLEDCVDECAIHADCINPPVCGDGDVEYPEVCECGPDQDCGSEDDDVNGQTCEGLGYDGGSLSCAGGCLEFFTGDCTGEAPVCGDGYCEPPEDAVSCPEDCAENPECYDDCTIEGCEGQPCGDEGYICVVGVCELVCDGGEIQCGGECVDPMVDENHCGECDNPCSAGQECINGICDIGEPIECETAEDCPVGYSCIAEICVEDVPTSDCVLTNAYWDIDETDDDAFEGMVVTLTVEGSDCDGEDINFEVYEDDFVLGDDLADVNPERGTFENGVVTSSWLAEYDPFDFLFPVNGYYFKANLVSFPSIETQSVDQLNIRRAQIDYVEHGYYDDWFLKDMEDTAIVYNHNYVSCPFGSIVEGIRFRKFDCDHTNDDCLVMDLRCKDYYTEEVTILGPEHVPEDDYYPKYVKERLIVEERCLNPSQCEPDRDPLSYSSCPSGYNMIGARLRKFDCDHSPGDCLSLDIACFDYMELETELVEHPHVPESNYYYKNWDGVYKVMTDVNCPVDDNYRCSPQEYPDDETFVNCPDGSYAIGSRVRAYDCDSSNYGCLTFDLQCLEWAY